MPQTFYIYKSQKTGAVYYLHGRKAEMRGGREQQIYYFAKVANTEFTLSELPEGFNVGESTRTGMPFLRRNK